MVVETPDGQTHEVREISHWRVKDIVKRLVNTYRKLDAKDQAYAIASELYALAHIGASRRRSVDPDGLRVLLWQQAEQWYAEYTRLGGQAEPFDPPTWNEPRLTWEEVFRAIEGS